jgi:hypothetical protein
VIPCASSVACRHWKRAAFSAALAATALVLAMPGATCTPSEGGDPFEIAQELRDDGVPRRIQTEIVSLGRRNTGEVLRLHVDSPTASAAYILRPDAERDAAGVIIDGGSIGAPFQHRVHGDAELFLFVEGAQPASTTVSLEPGNPDYHRPAGQTVRVAFENDFLRRALYIADGNPDTDPNAVFLRDIEPTVRDGIVERLAEIFADTGITVVHPGDDAAPPVSTLTFSAERRATDDASEFDAIAVAPDSGAACQSEFIVFGQVEPEGRRFDAGNRDPADTATVFVGSFRSAPPCDRGLIINSVNNIINALALDGAHEIGHLVGLPHSALEGIMFPQPTLAFQRQLLLARSQIVTVSAGVSGAAELSVQTNIIQDPQLYFDSIFERD